jgi:hypothetical protein
MHAGWPYLEETIALLFHYPEVNADLGATDWLLPKAEFTLIFTPPCKLVSAKD